jgi:polyhydroxyalkanoate synthesis regulator protein
MTEASNAAPHVYQAWKSGGRRLFRSRGRNGPANYEDPITLETLLTRLLLGNDIRVLEVKTRSDITHEILLALRAEREAKQPRFSEPLLRELIRLNHSPDDQHRLLSAFLDFMADGYAQESHRALKERMA